MGILKSVGKVISYPTRKVIQGGKKALDVWTGESQSHRLVDKQEESQERLSESNAKRNYEYGEMAADAAHERSLGLLEAQTQANSWESQVADAQNAGLSVGLLYGGGGAGGAGGRAGGGAQGEGAGGGAPQAPNYLDIAAVKNQRIANSIEAARTGGEIQVSKAEAEKIKAETEKIKEDTETSKELTPLQKALLKEQGIAQWIDNVRKDWENAGGEEGTSYRSKSEVLDATTFISKAGNFDKQQAAEIAKAISEVELNTEKKRSLWEEVLNARKREDTEAEKAAALKLAAEWSTGEYTNWKTWTELAGKATETLIDIIKSK